MFFDRQEREKRSAAKKESFSIWVEKYTTIVKEKDIHGCASSRTERKKEKKKTRDRALVTYGVGSVRRRWGNVSGIAA